MSNEIKVSVPTGIPGVKVDIHLNNDAYIAIESHYQNCSLHSKAMRNGDTAAVDCIAPLIEMDATDARSASLDLLRRAAKCPDRKERLSLKRLYGRGTRTLI
jgi:hypothetical protein